MSFITRRQFMKGVVAGATVSAGGRPSRALAQTTAIKPLDTFQHVVVLMLENRSFDNLLGYLYAPGELPPQRFAGVADRDHCNPIPPGALAPPGVTSVCLSPNTGQQAGDYNLPYPDPGEEYPHINTQLYNVVAPPYNVPKVIRRRAPMTGFVTDYIENYPTGLANPPTYDDYRIIMQSFTPQAVPVLSTLAREFAVFDHWFCSVPSQTWCNRAFWHAATSGGQVINPGVDQYVDWIAANDNPTLFNAISASATGLDWRVYLGNPLSLTQIIHAPALVSFGFKPFVPFEQFFTDCANGELPAYSFIEPTFITPNNDQHPPSYDSILFGPFDPGAVKLGEVLINRVYDAVRTSNSPTGNNSSNTLLIITHDEHGGCYDHVSPPAATAPDGQPGQPGQDGFTFDRLGVRVPMVMISAYIGAGTVVNSVFEHASFIRTMMSKWNLRWNRRRYLTQRDRAARSFEEVFTLAGSLPRDVSTWPVIADPVLSAEWLDIDYSAAPISPLQRSLLVGVVAQGRASAQAAERVRTVGEAMAFLETALPGAPRPPSRSFWLRRP